MRLSIPVEHLTLMLAVVFANISRRRYFMWPFSRIPLNAWHCAKYAALRNVSSSDYSLRNAFTRCTQVACSLASVPRPDVLFIKMAITDGVVLEHSQYYKLFFLLLEKWWNHIQYLNSSVNSDSQNVCDIWKWSTRAKRSAVDHLTEDESDLS